MTFTTYDLHRLSMYRSQIDLRNVLRSSFFQESVRSISKCCLLLSEEYFNIIFFYPTWVIQANAFEKQNFHSLKFNASYKLYAVKLLVRSNLANLR